MEPSDEASEASAVQLSLHRPRVLRIDVLPFATCYAVGFTLYLLVPHLEVAANVTTPILVVVHLLTFLTCHWSVAVRCALQLRTVRRAADATVVRVRPASGRSELCVITRRPAATDADPEELRFEYRKRTYVYEPPAAKDRPLDESSCFCELTMDLHRPLCFYLSGAKGLKAESLGAAQRKYGANSFEIPKITFGELMAEHALAPFFVFQVFCVLLWSLDDYWYYSLFTLVMLVVFESTVVSRARATWHAPRCVRAHCASSVPRVPRVPRAPAAHGAVHRAPLHLAPVLACHLMLAHRVI